MADYNEQKRNTLDRITDQTVRINRSIIKQDLQRRANDILFQLNSGENFLQDDDVKNLRAPMDDLFDRHAFVSVRSGISDGMLEVTPENELGLWTYLPNKYEPNAMLDNMRPQLGRKRDKLAEEALKKIKKRKAITLVGLRNLFLKDYLSVLRAGYKDLAKDWLAGQGTITDVQAMLTMVFSASTYDAKRIFRTETTNNFNEARADYFIDNTGMDYMQIFAITDGRTSQICEDRHKGVFPIEQARDRDKMPAFHPHCRTIQRPLTSRLSSHRKMIDEGLAMNPSTFTPLPRGWA